MSGIVHLCPPAGRQVTPCCGQSPFDLSRDHRITLDPSKVTCTAGSAPGHLSSAAVHVKAGLWRLRDEPGPGPAACEALSRAVTQEPPPLTLSVLADLASALPQLRRLELRCHPDVTAALRTALPPEPEPGRYGGLSALMGVPVTEQPDMEPGAWELAEDGEVIDSGRLGR